MKNWNGARICKNVHQTNEKSDDTSVTQHKYMTVIDSAYLVMELTSPELGGAIWWDVPITQSVRYSTNLLRNFISCRKAKSSLLIIMASTNWQSFVLMCIACTVISKCLTYLSKFHYYLMRHKIVTENLK